MFCTLYFSSATKVLASVCDGLALLPSFPSLSPQLKIHRLHEGEAPLLFPHSGSI